MVMLGLILLLCDAPFIESDHPALLLRSSRRTWTAGPIRISITSAVYFAVVYLLTVLVLLPHVGFEPGWGKVIHTFCQTRMAGQHGIVLPFDHQISNALGPVEANLLELLLCWLLGALLGLVLFVLNLTVNRSAGAICAAALAIFPLFVERAGWWMHYISPVSWASPFGGGFDGDHRVPLPGLRPGGAGGRERAAGPAGLSGHGAPGHRRVKICVKEAAVWTQSFRCGK